MVILYNIISLAIMIFYLPIYLCKRKFHKGFLLRFGFLPKDLKLNRPIWIHAVSVGEVMAIRGLTEELRKIYPGKKFVISTVTATGNKIANSLGKEGDFITYLPLDISFVVKSVIDKINPEIFIIAETEIWPNLISCLNKKNIPVVIINGRISDVSFRGYLALKPLIKPILRKVKLFCVQTQQDFKRFNLLGANGACVKVTGNLKFDISCHVASKENSARNRSKLGLGSKDSLIVAGSTHPGEEEIILSVYKELLMSFPDLKLLLAPRHPERSRDIAIVVSDFGFSSIFTSAITAALPDDPVFILDTIGELFSLYAAADIVFVGGSLVKKGGHNILEPACLAKPVLFGPHMFNFRDIADLFLRHKAVIKVSGKDELKSRIHDLLNNPAMAEQMGQRASQLILQNQGATQKTMQLIEAVLKKL